MVAKIGVLASFAAGLMLLAGGQPVQAQDKTVVKIALFTPQASSSSRWFELKKKEFAERTNGRLELQMYYGASMGPMPRHHDLARTGVADMSFFQHGVTPGRFPLVELTHLPYNFPPGAKGSIAGSKVAAELMEPYFRPEHEKAGTDVFWVVFNRPSGVWDAKKPITKLEDLKGRRYRAPTQTDVQMMRNLGALPIGMPANEMAESLQKGTIDGVVTDPMGVFSFQLGGLVKYYSNMFVSAISFGLAVNQDFHRKLPADMRAIVDEMGTKAAGPEMATYSWSDFKVFTDYMEKADYETVEVSEAADKAMRAAAQKVIDQKIADLEAKGHPAREVYAKIQELTAKFAAE